jgi:8-oxo-dGTP pyrophosphatase MutT (NUDIX family)
VHGFGLHAIILTVNDTFRIQAGLAGARALPPDWERRLSACVLAQPDHRGMAASTGPDVARDAAMRASFTGEWRPAAVLVPIVRRQPHSTVLLTRRHDQLQHHAGQISFPGGRLDEAGEDFIAAALRETQEETGIDARFVRPLGFLPDHHVLTGYRITPVVALVEPGFTLQPHADEVAEVFELPLSLALDEQGYVPVVRQLEQVQFASFDLPYGRHQIWGATAAMLRLLCLRFHAVGAAELLP